MSKPGFTPGPWRAGVPPLSDAGANEDQEAVAILPHVAFDATEIFVPRRTNGVSPTSCELAEFDANARLIAAAPDLYAALQELVWSSDDYDESEIADARCHAAIEAARAALTKAGGTAA